MGTSNTTTTICQTTSAQQEQQRGGYQACAPARRVRALNVRSCRVSSGLVGVSISSRARSSPVEGGEVGLVAQLEVCGAAGKGSPAILRSAPGSGAEHDDPVGEEDGLLDAVGDEHHGRASVFHTSSSWRLSRSRVNSSRAPNGSSISRVDGS